MIFESFKFSCVNSIWCSLVLASSTAIASSAELNPKYMPSFDFQDHDQGMHVFTIPIMHKISWNHPGPALWSILRNMLLNSKGREGDTYVQSSFGHMIVRVKCTDKSGRLRETWSGMSGQNDSSIDKEYFLKEKIGLSALFKSYLDGEVEGSLYNQNRVAKSLSQRYLVDIRRTKFMHFPLTPSQCSNVYEYYSAFVKRSYDHKTPVRELVKKRPQDVLHFGFTTDSYQSFLKYKRGDRDYRLGGGCTSYAVGFMKVTKVFDPYFDNFWLRRLYIPKSLMGGTDPQTGIKKEVPIASLLLGIKGFSKWDTPDPSRVPLQLYDPENVWNFINNAEKCVNSRWTCPKDVKAWLDQSSTKPRIAKIKTRFNVIRQIYNNDTKITWEHESTDTHTMDGIAFDAP